MPGQMVRAGCGSKDALGVHGLQGGQCPVHAHREARLATGTAGTDRVILPRGAFSSEARRTCNIHDLGLSCLFLFFNNSEVQIE